MNARQVHILIGLILAGTFLLDWLTPLGSQDFLLYVVPILLTAWLERAGSAYVVAALATGFVAAGVVLSPPGIPLEVAAINRSLSAAVFWITAFLVIRSREVARERDAQRLAAIVRSSADAILSQDLQGAVTSWNAAAERMLGYSPNEMLGHPISRLFGGEEQEQKVGVFRQLWQGASIDRQEMTWRRKDGGMIELLLSGSPLRNQGGEIVGTSIVAHDIAPLKQALQRLREQEERLNLVVSATKTGVWDWDLRTDGMYYSPLWKESLGYRPDELSNSQDEWVNRLHPDDRDRAFALVQQFLAGDIQTYELEHRLRHRDGSYRWIYTQALLMRDEQGAPIRMTGSHVDITERKQVEASLRQSEITLQSFFESAFLMMGVVKVCSDDVFHLSDNRATAQFFGTTVEALRGQRARQLGVPQDILDLWMKSYLRCIATRAPVQFEYAHEVTRGEVSERRILSVTVSFIEAGPDGLACCSYVAEDITERRRDEMLLRQAHELLERRVQERTSELASATQRARVLAQRLYEVQEADRRQLAQDLHDEIGQALTALKMNLQQVEREPLGPAARVGVEESIGISNQLLARVRSLALDLRPSLLDDLGLVPALRWYATRQAERMGWDLRLDLPESVPGLPAPRSIACFRVVQEALTNAARHAAATRVSVSLSVQDDQIRVTVQDDGGGFDIAGMRASAQQGRSMGLLGMEERISLAGGMFVMESAVGEGTRVEFSMPVAGSPQEPFVR